MDNPIQVFVKRGVPPFQVDDFGPDVGRSCKGALYFRPGATTTLNDAELQHIKKKHPVLASRLQVLATKAAAKPAAVKPVEPPKPEPLPPTSAEPEEVTESSGEPEGEESGSKRKKKRRY